MAQKPYQKRFTEAQLNACREHWLKIALSTDPVDKPKVEQGLTQAYKEAGFAPPSKIIYRDSPLQGMTAAVELVSQGGNPVADQVWHHVWNQTWWPIREQVGDRIIEQVKGDLYEQIRPKIDDQVWWWLRGEIGQQLIPRPRDQDRIWAWETIFFAQHDAPALARVMIFSKCPEVKKLAGLVQIAENAGWCFLFEHLAIVTPKPSKILWRKDECVHIAYPDGWSISRLSALEQLAAL